MRYLTFDELSPSMDVDRLVVHLAALGGATDRRSVGVWRRRSDLYADYVGVFAVEGGKLLGQTLVRRLPYTFPGGTEIIGAIASVGIRPDLARSGIAQGILGEVHRREREAGVRFAALWTNRSWGAHNLYQKLGYRDVYALPWAIHAARRAPARRLPPRGVRAARRSDLPDLERLHDRQAVGRLGFCRRPKRLLQTAAATHEIDPAKELVVARAGGRAIGYANIQSNPFRTLCGELVAISGDVQGTLLAEVERRAKGAPVALQHTLVGDADELLRDRGYAVLPAGWYGLLAKSLDRTWTSREAIASFATQDRRFLCQVGDRF